MRQNKRRRRSNGQWRFMPLLYQVRLRIDAMDMHLCPDPFQFYQELGKTILGQEPEHAMSRDCHSHALIHSSKNIVLYFIEKRPDEATIRRMNINSLVMREKTAGMETPVDRLRFIHYSRMQEFFEMFNTSHICEMFGGGVVVLISQLALPSCSGLLCANFLWFISDFQLWTAHIKYQKKLCYDIQSYIVRDLAILVMEYSHEFYYKGLQEATFDHFKRGNEIFTPFIYTWVEALMALSFYGDTRKEFEQRSLVFFALLDYQLKKGR